MEYDKNLSITPNFNQSKRLGHKTFEGMVRNLKRANKNSLKFKANTMIEVYLPIPFRKK